MDTNKKVDCMDDLTEVFYNLHKNMVSQEHTMARILEHNKKQDIKMDKQENRMDLWFIK